MNDIPTEFTIHGHTIKIKVVPESDRGNFGYYHDVKEEIILAENIREGSELIPLTEIQIFATMWHEIFHAFQWHSGKEFDEQEAQTYSGLITEFFNTKKYE